ncbi:hypothetical protein SAMN05444411_101899 [Lutibacter oricola]|uniref:Uncharacterized protein n=1 Tax=Lutibacter oricola TaxID=762486 RepID=A0A1H2U5Y6_9FLAO|nr:hypothetical protein [Lutibacter oricola]SDW51652.1 hypothetical protein SAMN05444411_101899 [Lutibacter oricola]
MISKGKIYKEIGIGIIAAAIATLIGCFLFVEFYSKYSFEKSLALIIEGNLESKVLVLGAIANFFVFFVFLKKNQIYRARGVLIASFIIAILVAVLTLFF